MKNRWLMVLIPVLLMALITPFTPYLDLSIERFFFNQGEGNVEHFVSHPFFDFLFSYGILAAWIVVIPACFALLFSYLFKSFRFLRPHALFLVLTLAIGAGLIVHTMLKDNWGRPRPVQVVEFGGGQEFRPWYQPNFSYQPEPSKSFPCGHCTMGFFFFTFVLMGLRFHKRWLMILGILLTVFFASALGLTRMAQGGHFFSDVLMTGVIMWLVALFFDWLIYEELE